MNRIENSGVAVGINAVTGRDLIALAHQRNDPKERFNAYSTWHGAQVAAGKATSSLDNHILGLFGEWAAGQVLGGVDVDREVYRNHGDRGIADLTLPDGSTVQVKTRAKPGYDFALGPREETLIADYAVLCWPRGGVTYGPGYWAGLEASAAWPRGLWINVYGFASRQWFADHAVYKDYGYGVRLVLEPWQFQQVFLRPIPAALLGDVLHAWQT